MKYLILFFFASQIVFAANNCTESTEKRPGAVYNVNKEMPAYMKGATIIVKLADGRSSVVPAEKFMVVPRKQYTVAGESLVKTVTCKSKTKRDTFSLDVRKDIVGLETESSSTPVGTQAKVVSKKDIVLGVNYYRRELFGSDVGAGLGVDTNSVFKGTLGFDTDIFGK
jgi:hypothetical protein